MASDDGLRWKVVGALMLVLSVEIALIVIERMVQVVRQFLGY